MNAIAMALFIVSVRCIITNSTSHEWQNFISSVIYNWPGIIFYHSIDIFAFYFITTLKKSFTIQWKLNCGCNSVAEYFF